MNVPQIVESRHGTGQHRRDLVAGDRGFPDHFDHQRQDRGHQPARQGHGPPRLRLLQARQITRPACGCTAPAPYAGSQHVSGSSPIKIE